VPCKQGARYDDRRRRRNRSIQPRRETLRQLGKSARTLERYELDPELGFPKAIKINGRKHDVVRKLQQWVRDQAAKVAS
jgi:hypothetical protein